MTEQAELGFGGLLRRLRDDAGLTQDELAEAARVSQRAVSDLERGINRTARKDTAVLLAGALGLDGPARELFIAAARGRAPAGEALAAASRQAGAEDSAAASSTLPRDIAALSGRQDGPGPLMGAGTVTFLFTDIEGSTALLRRVGEGAYARLLADHHALVRSVLAAHGGRELNTLGDGFFAAFASPRACVAAVVAMQQALEGHAWPAGERLRVRMGVHTGEASDTTAGLVGLDVHRAARVAAVAHGGQVLVSETAAALVRDTLPPGTALIDLGVHQLKDLGRPEQIFQVSAPGLQAEFPPLRTLASPAAAATRTLPRDVASFTGRQDELARLAGAVDGLSANGGVVGIHAIGGMAGIGKTTFAVHAAHRLAESFPDGQFFLPLHAHTPGQRPVSPADALASLLLTAGVPAAQIPPGTDARAARWRDHLAGKMVLLVLDDAAGHEQVRLLLPGTPGSLVLITSRRRLAALEDAAVVSLDALAPGEATGLLARLAGRADVTAGDPAVVQLAALCGCLPLAIGMVARQLHHHPAWSAGGRAAELAAAQDRLELMATENLSVAAAFNLSYADLTDHQQRLLRRLGLHPGADIDGYAAAALDGTDLAAARRGLEALYDQYLLTEPARGRYRLHDLIREHARALAARLDPDRDRDQATARLLDYYQHTAARAGALIARQTRPAPAPADGAMLAAVPDLASSERALAWARAERASLLACLDHAAGTGQHARVIALTSGLAGLWENDGAWADAITRHTAAIQAARHLGDLRAQANALNDLGVMRRSTGDYPAAARAQEQALGIYRDLGDRLGQANALIELGAARMMTNDYPAAARAQEQALGIYRDLGDRLGQATALSERGLMRRMTGDYPAAARAQEQALGIYRDLGDRLGQANALNRLGVVRQLTGDYRAAAQIFDQTLGIYRDLGELLGQAHTLAHLGELRRMTGDYPGAVQVLEQALDIVRDLGDRGGEATALNERGTLHRISSELAQAEGCHQQALELARAIGSPWDEAHALAGLGRCALAAGHAPQAEVLLAQALEIFQRIGAAEGQDLLAELDLLTSAPPGPRRTTSA